jgi:hypothetical protein
MKMAVFPVAASCRLTGVSEELAATVIRETSMNFHKTTRGNGG